MKSITARREPSIPAEGGRAMEYTGKWWHMDSAEYGPINVLEYKDSNGRYPYCDCDRCGQPIKRHMFVIQCAEEGPELDVEMAYLGSECIKHLK